ncbi:AraC family transcriptional regulator [bacterium]|nr:AraC family transcriptional regulator [bacterium]MDY3023687.1 helix-turn-helix domain-containing protein [Oliverpabstia sp.]
MDWIDRMNEAMEYIENHLQCEIDEKEISDITACSFQLFQGTFSQITGITVAEYIRRRKMTCAAYDLQNTDKKIIDIALEYGYQSADAFSVAFKRLHNVTPRGVRNGGVKLTFYCRINFNLTVKGIDRMNYVIIEKGPFNVMGVRRSTPYGGGTWAVVKSDGSNEAINNMCGHFYDLGLCFDFDEEGNNDYMCAVEWKGEVVGNLDYYQYPEATWIKFEAEGSIVEGTLGNVWKRINDEFLPQSKYKKSGHPTIEKYILWDETADICRVEIWIPVVMK